jgi:hypothetical protein
LIEKIKIAVALFLCLSLLIASGLFMMERRANSRLKEQQEQALSKLRLDHLKDNIRQGRALEQKTLKPKKTITAGKDAEASARELESQKESCNKCFENFEYEVEVKDQDGRWIFKDSNIFDQTPGELVLTDRFWKEVENGAGPSLSPSPKAAVIPKRLKNRIMVGFEIDHTKIEYAYSPLGFRKNNFELGLSIYSSLSLNYSFMPTAAEAGVGVEARF